MFLSRNKKKNNVYPYKPQFYYIKVGFKGVKLYRHVFEMIYMHGRTVLTLNVQTPLCLYIPILKSEQCHMDIFDICYIDGCMASNAVPCLILSYAV